MCRWLLMTLDRSVSNELTVTQGMIGKLLGVRRESVTQILGQLEKDHVIKRARGRITVLDRRILEKRVCECYAVVHDEYERLLPGKRGSKN
jgi:Mn-dependent DtxR family transcriptional regulator